MMCPGDPTDTRMAGSGLLDLRNSFPPSPDSKDFGTASKQKNMPIIASVSFAPSSYTRILEQMSKLYPYDPAAVAASLSALRYSFPSTLQVARQAEESSDQRFELSPGDVGSKGPFAVKQEREDSGDADKALDLTTQNMNAMPSAYHRIPLDKVKPKIVEDLWVENDINLAWTDSRIAAYNPAQKLFMCLDCECVGFLSRVAEHWLGAHANLRVFHCPRCPYTSAWSRCVKMHLTRQHSEQFADTTMWKENTTLLEVTQLMQELRTKVETKIDASNLLSDKRFYCPHCPYATDRRDLYTRHENIHKDNKPFHCYLCFKQFNRADHVKKHFVRMHADSEYDISKIRKNQNSNKNQVRAPSEVIVPPKSSLLPLIPKTQPMEPTSAVEQKPTITLSDTETITVSPSPPQNSTVVFSNLSRTPITSFISQSPSSIVQEATSPLLGTKSLSPEPSGRTKRRGDKAYTCHYCNWSGSDNWCLKRHMNTHIKPFACIMCDYKAARAERLSTHVWKVHNKRICNKCNFLADTQERLLEHTREEHHNNPYSRRHICSSCGLSFDTRANFETHIHIAHARPKSPVDVAQITPIILPTSTQEIAQDLTIKPHLSYEEEQVSLICPIEDCGIPFSSSGSLADHVRQNHGGLFASRCPHCGYNLTQDELSKDHWLTHHEDVCCACVHVFTSVYGPQLWKKVHARPRSDESPLNVIVSGLNKRRTNPSSPSREDDESDPEIFAKLECQIRIDSSPGALLEGEGTRSPPPEDMDTTESEKISKRKRKQSRPKKVITVQPSSAVDEENSSKGSDVDVPQNVSRKVQKMSKKLKRRRCLKCPHRPTFSSYARFRAHRFKRHRLASKLAIKRNLKLKNVSHFSDSSD